MSKRISYVLLTAPGGRLPLGAALTNGAVILKARQLVGRVRT